MKNKKYLIVLCSHVDSQVKKNKVLSGLKHFRNEGIDVCFSTHSNSFIEDFSSMSKFCYFDNNNEFLSKDVYLKNADALGEDFLSYGISTRFANHSFGRVIDHKPGSPHSRSALSLLQNGVSVSYTNFYDWTIYLEYDIEIPLNGFKDFIESKIELLEKNGKKCFYYKNDTENFKFLWGGLFIFKTKEVFENSKLFLCDWKSTDRNWVLNWKLGFFESIVENVLLETFGKENCLTLKITEETKSVWGLDSYRSLSNFKYEQTFFREENSLIENLDIGIYPAKQGENIKLLVYCFNNHISEMNLKSMVVRNHDSVYLEINNNILHPFTWNLWQVDFSGNQQISFEYEISNGVYSKSGSESIHIENLAEIHDKICRIELS